jgi:hypothetical protein
MVYPMKISLKHWSELSKSPKWLDFMGKQMQFEATLSFYVDTLMTNNWIENISQW